VEELWGARQSRFAETAALADYEPEDLEIVRSAGNELVRQLQQAGSTVEAEIPRTIRWMIDALRRPGPTSKRAVFGLVRTMENLFSIVFRSLGDVLNAAKTGVERGTKAAVTISTAILLLQAAAEGATRISPVAARVIQTSWLSEAAKVAAEAIKKAEKLGD